MEITTKTEKFTNALYLESGRILEPFEISYETYGELNEDKSNVIVVCHALTGSHHAAGYYDGEKKPGWWDDLIGDGKAIDTSKYYVICYNTIGSCFGSTGPTTKTRETHLPYRYKFPVITVKDMVKAGRLLFDRLGIHKVKAVIGGSMGGMQALHFAVDFPNFAEKTIALATTHATRPWAIAFNKVATSALLNDPDFKDGNYDFDEVKEKGLQGLSIGRMAGFISFLSPDTMMKKFGRDYMRNDGLFDLFGRFQIDSYLDYNGQNFPKWFDPLSFIYIAKAINIYDVSRGYDSLEDALERVKTDLHLISFRRDLLFLPEEMAEIQTAFDELGKENCSYREVDSDYGHDAFLVEVDKFEADIRKILEE
ncbi:MAG: homoserine O-acetyltransferase [Campylobacterales bacterium]|nr:homoserine O-acetyltransferase [Campylobacterales bacterium]